MTAPRCSFAYPGTYGHECGKPATLAGVRPSTYTRSGVYWAHRCADCTTARGIDNQGVRAWVPIDPAAHTNDFTRDN